MKTAVLVLSQSGFEIARRIRAADPGSTLIFGPSCVVGHCSEKPASGFTFPTGEHGVYGWVGPLRKAFPAFWGEFDAIVGVMALGIVVRLVGPLAADKRNDPAVIVVDDAGRFVISVLGGHAAGGNALTRVVANVLGATPVITTASEARGLPAVDLIGKDLGWTIERRENLTRVAASVVRGETVAVWQDRDASPADWCAPFGPWPASFVAIDDPTELDAIEPAAVLIISDRVVADDRFPADRTLIYRPRSLVAGIGCKRGTSREAIEAWFEQVFAERGLSPASLAAVATVTLKADEPGLIAFAEARGVPLLAFPPEELEHQPGIETPSARVREKIGIPAVAEASALRAGGASRLLVTKQVGEGVTLAVARVCPQMTQINTDEKTRNITKFEFLK